MFKATKLTEWQLSHKEGDVTEVYDKELAKNVLKISGVTTASNYIQLPASKHLPKKTLGLTGKYVTIDHLLRSYRCISLLMYQQANLSSFI